MRLEFNSARYRTGIVVSLLFLLFACFEDRPPAKDLTNFTLPESVKAQAPEMEGHLLRMVVYNSGRFPIKPGFVFIDDGHLTMGAPDVMINRLNMLHLAYRTENRAEWSGSLVHPVEGGANVFSTRGYSIGLRAEGDRLHLSFRDGDTVFKLDFKADEDMERDLGGKNGAPGLYVNHYVFPEELVARGRQAGRKDKKP